MALETGCVAHQGEQKSAGKIRLGGESIMWEIAGKGERLDVVFLVRPCPSRCVGPKSSLRSKKSSRNGIPLLVCMFMSIRIALSNEVRGVTTDEGVKRRLLSQCT